MKLFLNSVFEMHIALQNVNYEITWLIKLSVSERVSEFHDNKVEQSFPLFFEIHIIFYKNATRNEHLCAHERYEL